jgi:hypothetical protein
MFQTTVMVGNEVEKPGRGGAFFGDQADNVTFIGCTIKNNKVRVLHMQTSPYT